METYQQSYDHESATNISQYNSMGYSPLPRSLTNEEAENLSGMVANRRALFEQNSTKKNIKITPRPVKLIYKTHADMSPTVDNFTNLLNQQTNVKQSISANNVNKFIQDQFNVNNCFPEQNESDKENTTVKSSEIITKNLEYNYNLQANAFNNGGRRTEPFKSSIIGKHIQNYQRLWSTSEETSRELNIPISVKQAKLCFESMANLNKNSNTSHKANPIQSDFSKLSHRYPCQREITASQKTDQTLGKEIKQEENFLASREETRESPDIINLLSSSSTSSSISSASVEASSVSKTTSSISYNFNSVSSDSGVQSKLLPSTLQDISREPTSRPDSQLSQNSDTMSVDIKGQLKYRTSNIANKIKKLESKFSRNEDSSSFRLNQSSLVSASTSSNESFTKSSYQSPKFLQLFQKQMDLNGKDSKTVQCDDESEDVEVPLTITKPNLRKITSSSSIGSSSSSSSTSSASSANDSLDQKAEVEINQNKIDSAPCVLPSFLRKRPTVVNTTPAAVSTISSHLSKKISNDFSRNETEKNQQKTYSTKLEKVDISSKPASWQTVGAPKPNGRSSYTSGFVKNNAAMFNRNSDPIGTTQVGFKKVNRSAATAREALIRWCRNRTIDYDNVSIENFSSSWSNGLAFCALINHFLPDAFDYNSLDANNRRYNFELAFKTAEEKAGIVQLLDVEDMIEMGNSPDWKCVFTYVHSIYSRFKETA